MAEANEQHEQQAAGLAAGDRRTRRRVLAGAAGVLGVAAAEVVGQAAPAQADNGSPVLQGTDNTFPTRRTAVFTPGNHEVGILADPNQSGKGSLGVYGIGLDAGVRGEGGTGVIGTGTGSGVGSGVQGSSSSAIGVLGSTSGTGMQGVSGQDLSVGGGVGVEGNSNKGIGVLGTTNGDGAPGVWGRAGGKGSAGARGTAGAADSTGVLAENIHGGTALQVSGPAVFSRSGVLTVPAGSSRATQTGVALTAVSLVLATLQQNLSGVYVRAAVPNVTGNSFTVYLSKTVTAAVNVGWFVVN